MKQIIWTVIIVSFIAGSCIFVYCSYKLVNKATNSKLISKILIREDTVFTVQKFVTELQIQGVKFPDIVLRQACLESGFFTSNIWKKYNNPFGFCFKDKYLQFDDYKQAIKYYKDWQDRWFPYYVKDRLIDSNSYYKFLNDIQYASDSLYIQKLKGINLDNLK